MARILALTPEERLAEVRNLSRFAAAAQVAARGLEERIEGAAPDP